MTTDFRPTFPTDLLPNWLGHATASVAGRLQVAEDLPGVAGLLCVSAAIGAKVSVQAWEGFRQPCVLWGAVTLESGENKTAAMEAMKAPLRDYERQRRTDDTERFKNDRRTHDLLKRQAEAVAKKAATGGDPAALEEASRAMKDAEEAEPRPLYRLSIDGFTTEAFVKALEATAGYVIHLESEGDGFIDIAGRYDSEGLLKPFLDAYDGASFQLDRSSKGHIVIDSARFVFGVCVQPEALARILSKQEFRGRGLLERCLFSMPYSLVGSRDMRRQAPAGDAEVLYAQKLGDLARTFLDATVEPRVLPLRQDAIGVYEAARARIEPRLLPDGDLAPIRAWISKLQGGTMLRLAGVLQLAHNPTAKEVSSGVMEKAAALVEDYFIPHGLFTLGQLRGGGLDRTINQVLPWVLEQPGAIGARDLQRHRGDLFKTAEEAEEALEAIAETGQLEAFTPPWKGTGRKPKTKYQRPDRRQIRQNSAKARSPQTPSRKGESVSSGDLSELSVLSGGGAA